MTIRQTIFSAMGRRNGHSAGALQRWLRSRPLIDGNYKISEPRNYTHEETDYDAQYGNDPRDLEPGQGCAQLAREYASDLSGAALEIGCGTGLMSLGLVAEKLFNYVLLTDPSPAFLEITRKKMVRCQMPADRIGYAVLDGEGLDLLPGRTFSLIALRSVLHHVLDLPKFFSQCAKALKTGGILAAEEPCSEGAILMASIAQFLPVLVARSGETLTPPQAHQLDLFLRTMNFYCRRDRDKTGAEDKHIFRPMELAEMAREVGLTLTFLPNKTYFNFAPRWRQHTGHESFSSFFREYFKYSMSFDDSMLKLFDEQIAPFCQWADELALMGDGPYMHGLLVFHKDS